MASTVIDSLWFTIKIPMFSLRDIGIVAVKCDVTGKVKFYIGLGRGENTKEDEQGIYKMGVPFYPIPFMQWIITMQKQQEQEQKKQRS